ncbi:DnaJ C-terminal domain-containing protein [Actinomycetes bacterium KLBMP 9797]
MSGDYYTVLGVDRDASAAEIQRAYRRLARRYHPDLNDDPAAEEAFQRITEAYQALSDLARRARHDGRRDGPLPGRPIRVKNRHAPRPGPAPTDPEAELALTVEDAYHGGPWRVTMPTPAGPRTRTVDVPAGATDGQRLRVPGLCLVVRVLPHARYRLDGRDLAVDLPVAPWEAALGGSVPVDTPGGSVRVDLPPGSSTGRRLRLPGRGLPNPTGPPGDLYAEVRIVVPARSSPRERDLWQRLAEESSFDPRTLP